MKRFVVVVFIQMFICFIYSQDCDAGYTDVNDLCFHDGDLSILQRLIDNSYQSGINLGCEEGDQYCGSPNPYMDSNDAWFWVLVDSISYQWPGDESGSVDPLELGLQEWNNGRLTSLMCGAYIYCQLSGPIPEEINQLTEITTLRLEMNYLSGFVPETLCDLQLNEGDYLEFDLGGNRLCPPYPECSGEQADFWYQNTSSCSEIGDINFDLLTNVQDVIHLVTFILDLEVADYQQQVASDINFDGVLDVLDIIELVEQIINRS